MRLTAALALLSMAGVPLGAGFIAKELAYDALADGGFAGSSLVLGIVVVGSMLTVAYAARFYWGAFVQPRRSVALAAEDEALPPSPVHVRQSQPADATLCCRPDLRHGHQAVP